ncbi:hydrogen peroxide-inducible genes activator [Pseudenhygromyxa sp. WMMC2535]|uniref:hydrogen peroxide-inducible genes activator n=1 Tax=Pseudenhygromyxa sp. WMMC2535 TaxID=2712867 RepID=UPI001553D0C5|nr:hydrogen peroxide-inducible genes activator [Pseudenhygromyxa sp. WMMC2535]NVB38967.1 hydrogen peroxide-inducible genes activator [Pseudenhygromyxa sp. WMMC2535]
MRYAVAVGDARSFRTAAERCHISQSGLSMQIRKLEELLEVALFDRGKKPVLVTPEGEVVLGQMRTVLRETERLGQIAAAQGEPSGPHRLGVIPTLAASVLPLFLKTFIERYPQVELIIEELKTEEIIARLREDTLDAGIAATPLGLPELHEEALGYEALFAYLQAEDPLLRKKRVAQADLRERELWVMPEGHCFRSQVLSYCDASSAPEAARIRFESGSFETLMRLVDGGLGATVVPALALRELPPQKYAAQVRPLVAPTPVREIGLVTARTDYRRQVNAALVEVVRGSLEQPLGARPRRAVVLEPI